MRLEHAGPRDLKLVAPIAAADSKVAVLVNANARRVTGSVLKSLSHVVPYDDLFVSKTQIDARRIARTVLERRYATAFCGGGDGTFVAFLNEFLAEQKLRGEAARAALPRFGVLKLGTGNAIATTVGASPLRGDRIVDDVLRARSGEVSGYRTIDLLSVDGRRTHFAGLGVDGRVLNDYLWVKTHFGSGLLGRAVSGGRGYFSSVSLRTIPHYLLHSSSVQCEVRNGPGKAAYRLHPDGSIAETIEPGGTLFSGDLMIAAAATVPYYGFSFRMFPFAAKRRGMMHLRLGTASVVSVLGNLHKLWSGRWFPPGILDFHVHDATIRFGRPMPFQVAGDAAGYRETVHLAVAPEQVDLVDFTGTVH